VGRLRDVGKEFGIMADLSQFIQNNRHPSQLKILILCKHLGKTLKFIINPS